MPDIDTLMEEWPPEFEELLKEVGLLELSNARCIHMNTLTVMIRQLLTEIRILIYWIAV